MGNIEVFEGMLNSSTLCNEEVEVLTDSVPASPEGLGVWTTVAAFGAGIIATYAGLKVLDWAFRKDEDIVDVAFKRANDLIARAEAVLETPVIDVVPKMAAEAVV